MQGDETRRVNAFGQEIGAAVPGWTAAEFPRHERMVGTFCELEPLSVERHAEALWEANGLDGEGRNWTYLPYGPFGNFEDYRGWMEGVCAGRDPQFYAVVSKSSGRAVGVASYLRIAPETGGIEVGHIHFSEVLKRTAAATEAMYLMMRRVFELGYRRYEWKCDALNAGSRSAAERLGFTFEGVFRQATVYKGRNRDTAWYSVVDGEWEGLRERFERWLAPGNFDGEGREVEKLKS